MTPAVLVLDFSNFLCCRNWWFGLILTDTVDFDVYRKFVLLFSTFLCISISCFVFTDEYGVDWRFLFMMPAVFILVFSNSLYNRNRWFALIPTNAADFNVDWRFLIKMPSVFVLDFLLFVLLKLVICVNSN